jgi:hypothetical protein
VLPGQPDQLPPIRRLTHDGKVRLLRGSLGQGAPKFLPCVRDQDPPLIFHAKQLLPYCDKVTLSTPGYSHVPITYGYKISYSDKYFNGFLEKIVYHILFFLDKIRHCFSVSSEL